MKILRASKNDVDEILSLQKTAFMPLAKLLDDMQIQPLRQTRSDLLKEFESLTALKCIDDNARIVASIRAYCDTDNVCKVGKLFVAPQCQKRGIGKNMILEIEKYFPACEKFSLFTAEITPYTRKLYESCGYHEKSFSYIENIKMVFMEKQNNSI